jgi:hypothetical protein
MEKMKNTSSFILLLKMVPLEKQVFTGIKAKLSKK